MMHKVITSGSKTEKKSVSVYTKALRLGFLLFLTFTVGYVGGTFVTPEAMIWYDGLILSTFNPPSHWFGIAWGILYMCMSFAAWIVWGRVSPRPFAFQLAFNLLWPFLFFFLQSPILALIDTILMIIFIVITICKFGKVSLVAGGLMVPVLLWSLFALYLNLITVLFNTVIGIWFGFI